ncbi:hypothetical protein PS023_23665, partial [Shigella sonnei]|nr:hypothetical protein [Shigella sonnei]
KESWPESNASSFKNPEELLGTGQPSRQCGRFIQTSDRYGCPVPEELLGFLNEKAGLKVTLPRLKILEVLQEPDQHEVSA